MFSTNHTSIQMWTKQDAMHCFSIRNSAAYFVRPGGTQWSQKTVNKQTNHTTTNIHRLPKNAVPLSTTKPNTDSINCIRTERVGSTTFARIGSRTKGSLASVLVLILSLIAPTPTDATSRSRREFDSAFPALASSYTPLRDTYAIGANLPASFSALQPIFDLGDKVFSSNACNMPGCSIKYDTFVPAMWQAVALGHVSHEHASFVAEGLRWGFKAGVDTEKLSMNGHRWFKNYKTALDNSGAVSKAVLSRVSSGKTLDLGPWTEMLSEGLRTVFTGRSEARGTILQ